MPRELFESAGYLQLSIPGTHATAVESLPAIHSDPFNHILVAQALTEPMRSVTYDRTVARYSDTVIFA